MKTDFNFRRINLLFRKEWEEKRWYYLATLLVYYSCTTILFIWTSLTTISEHLDYPAGCIQGQENNCFFIIMLLSLLVAASRGTAFFSDCNDKRGSTGFLTLPASIQEKFFVKWLYTVPLTFCAFLICVLLADYTRVFICSQIYPEVDICQPLQWNTDEHNFYSWTLLLLFLQSIFMLGSTMWKKNAFVRTGALLMALMTIYIMTAGSIIEVMVTDDYYLNYSFANFMYSLILWIIIIAFWILTYYRVKETDVAYGHIRPTSYFIIGLAALGLIVIIALSCYVATHYRQPKETVRLTSFHDERKLHKLPAFNHLILREETPLQPDGITTDTTKRSIYYSSSSSITVSADSTSDFMLDVPEPIWPYLKMTSHSDTLIVEFYYPQSNYTDKFNDKDKSKLDLLKLQTGDWKIRTGTLKSVTCEIPVTEFNLIGFNQKEMTVCCYEAKMHNCRIDRLHLKYSKMPKRTIWIPGTEQRRALTLESSKIGLLYRTEKDSMKYIIKDKAYVDSCITIRMQ